MTEYEFEHEPIRKQLAMRSLLSRSKLQALHAIVAERKAASDQPEFWMYQPEGMILGEAITDIIGGGRGDKKKLAAIGVDLDALPSNPPL